MTIKERYAGVIEWFEQNMAQPETELNYRNGYELLVAVILSAQCTDKRVNEVCLGLFAAYPTLEDMAAVFGQDRPISLCRELTKLHEEVVRTTLGEAVEKYRESPPRGEFVLVIAGAVPVPTVAASVLPYRPLLQALNYNLAKRQESQKSLLLH